MATQSLVNAGLLPQAVTDGARLIERLDQRGWSVATAFWRKDPENDRWDLVLTADWVERTGKREGYGYLIEAEGELFGDLILALEDVTLVFSDDWLVRYLPAGTSRSPGLAYVRSGMGSVDAYVYRFPPAD